MILAAFVCLMVMVDGSCAQPDRGFEYYFTDNDIEKENIQLKFDKQDYQLPTWVRGTYVSLIGDFNSFGAYFIQPPPPKRLSWRKVPL
jgi:hypothetical protein